MKAIKYTAALLALASTASAQQLNKEITIDREINLTLNDADRQSRLPSILPPKIDAEPLQFSDITTAAPIAASLTTLDAAAPATALPATPYKGYATVGYFPVLNLGASAGYRFINNSTTSLGAWLQYDGKSYKETAASGADLTLDRHTATFGADFTRMFHRVGRLDIKASATLNYFNRPWLHTDSTTTTHAVDASAVWSARNREAGYFILAGYERFGFSGRDGLLAPSVASAIDPSLAQNIFTARCGIAYFISEKSTVTSALSAEFSNFTRSNTLDPYTSPLPVIDNNHNTRALITLTPAYRFNTRAIGFTIGARVQFSTRTNNLFHIAPDVSFRFKAGNYFALNLHAGGGEHINRLADLFMQNTYMSPSFAYAFSHVPITFDGTITVGPFRGASLQLFGGYAAANDWLMPVIANGNSLFAPEKMRAWHAGARIDYNINDNYRISASYTSAPGSLRHTWYLNPDRARNIVSAAIQAKPLDGLTLDLTFEMRANRTLAVINPTASLAAGNPASSAAAGSTSSFVATTTGNGTANLINLHNSNSLNFGASYRILSWMTVYGRVENILDRRASLLSLHTEQGIHGLLGLALKF